MSYRIVYIKRCFQFLSAYNFHVARICFVTAISSGCEPANCGMITSEIIEAYPDLETEDIAQALRFAAHLTKQREILLSALK